MSRFGWAYVNCDEDPGHANIEGVTGSVMFLTGNNSLTGSDLFRYFTSSYGDLTPSTLLLRGNMVITGTLSASQVHYESITRIDATGSTFFGDTAGDKHARTGSLLISSDASNAIYEVLVHQSQSVHHASVRYAYTSVSGGVGVVTYASASIGDYIIGVKGQCPVEIRLPAASASAAMKVGPAPVGGAPMTGTVLIIKDEFPGERMVAGTVPAAIFLSGTDGETIDGEPYYQMTGSMTAISLYSNGSNWFVF
jgi:hypothetical protein